MKLIYLVPILFGFTTITAQSLDSVGLDDDPILNTSEAELLQSIVVGSENGYSLNHKKAAFITGSAASRFEVKSDFFQHSILPWTSIGRCPSMSIVILTEEEKILSGGYDVLVLAWVVVLTKGRRKRIVKHLGAYDRM